MLPRVLEYGNTIKNVTLRTWWIYRSILTLPIRLYITKLGFPYHRCMIGVNTKLEFVLLNLYHLLTEINLYSLNLFPKPVTFTENPIVR